MCILIIMLGYGDDVICTLRGVISDRAVVIEALVEKTSSCGCGSHGYGLNGIGMRKGAQYKVLAVVRSSRSVVRSSRSYCLSSQATRQK